LEEDKTGKGIFIFFAILGLFFMTLSIQPSSLRFRQGPTSTMVMEPGRPSSHDETFLTHRNENSTSADESEDSEEHWDVLGVSWDSPAPAEKCSSYGTREYSARLNVPFFSSWKGTCEKMPPMKIHGQTFAKPERCDSQVGEHLFQHVLSPINRLSGHLEG
jgi:hypothetical protein